MDQLIQLLYDLGTINSKNVQQNKVDHLQLLIEAMRIKAKGEPTIPIAEVKRRIADMNEEILYVGSNAGKVSI